MAIRFFEIDFKGEMMSPLQWLYELILEWFAEAFSASAAYTGPVSKAVFVIDDAIYYYIATVIISYILTVALTPKPKTPPPAALGEFDFPQAEEGTPQAVFFGDVWTKGWMVLTVGNYRTEEIEMEGKK